MAADALPEPVRAAIDAANAGDVEGFLAVFTDDGVVDDWGREFHGHRGVRTWSDAEFIGVAVTLEVTGVRVAGSTVTVAATVGGNGFNGPSHFAFDVDGATGLIRRMTITG